MVPAQEGEAEYPVGEIHEAPDALKMPLILSIFFTTGIFVLFCFIETYLKDRTL